MKLVKASLQGVREVNVARGCHSRTPEYVLQKTESFLGCVWECVCVLGEGGERQGGGRRTVLS